VKCAAYKTRVKTAWRILVGKAERKKLLGRCVGYIRGSC
jgi:hypothetical protein